jgi:uncharacterized protein YndB with AHSA1/START domain
MEATAVERTIWIAAPIERAWRAVTEPEALSQWYATCCRWEIPALEAGATIKFYNTDTDIQLATIEIVDPPRRFTLRWQPAPEYPGTELVTTFLLEEENGGTRATIIETGYETLPDEVRQQMVDATAGGYCMSVENLKAYVEGRSLPYR